MAAIAGRVATAKPEPRKPGARKDPQAKAAGAMVAGIALTRPERVYRSEAGITTLDLARYLEAVAPRLLPISRAGRCPCCGRPTESAGSTRPAEEGVNGRPGPPIRAVCSRRGYCLPLPGSAMPR